MNWRKQIESDLKGRDIMENPEEETVLWLVAQLLRPWQRQHEARTMSDSFIRENVAALLMRKLNDGQR